VYLLLIKNQYCERIRKQRNTIVRLTNRHRGKQKHTISEDKDKCIRLSIFILITFSLRPLLVTQFMKCISGQLIVQFVMIFACKYCSCHPNANICIFRRELISLHCQQIYYLNKLSH
jgi:hypothetical protein